MKKIKVLYTGLSPKLGGIENFLINVYRNIDKNKVEISFLVFSGEKVCFFDELKNDGVKFFEITSRKDNYLRFINDLKNVYIKNEFDYIHFNLVNYNCPERILLANKYSNAKLIIHSHNGNMERSKKNILLHNIGRFLIRKIDVIRLACGDEAGNFLFGDSSFEVINNGIELDKFIYDEDARYTLRKSLGINNEFCIGLIARFDEQKNHKFLIDIFDKYQRLNSDSKLILIGEGILKNTIIEKVKQLGLEDKVMFLGKRMDANKLYSIFDIYLMPSIFEGLSISIVEAQVNGLKCYTSTNVDKNSNVTGNVMFLDLNKSEEYWAKKIFDDDTKRDSNSLEKIPDIFYIENTAKKLMQIYDRKKE